MTYHEAIEVLRERYMDNECYFAEHDCYPKDDDADFQEAVTVAIKALNDVQKYNETNMDKERRKATDLKQEIME